MVKKFILIILLLINTTVYPQRIKTGGRCYFNYNLGTTYLFKYKYKLPNDNIIDIYTFILGLDNNYDPVFHDMLSASYFDDNLICVKIVYKFKK